MRISAPTQRVAAPPRDLSERSATCIRGHKQRKSLLLPWRVNSAIAGMIGLGIAVCILLQM